MTEDWQMTKELLNNFPIDTQAVLEYFLSRAHIFNCILYILFGFPSNLNYLVLNVIYDCLCVKLYPTNYGFHALCGRETSLACTLPLSATQSISTPLLNRGYILMTHVMCAATACKGRVLDSEINPVAVRRVKGSREFKMSLNFLAASLLEMCILQITYDSF